MHICGHSRVNLNMCVYVYIHACSHRYTHVYMLQCDVNTSFDPPFLMNNKHIHRTNKLLHPGQSLINSFQDIQLVKPLQIIIRYGPVLYSTRVNSPRARAKQLRCIQRVPFRSATQWNSPLLIGRITEMAECHKHIAYNISCKHENNRKHVTIIEQEDALTNFAK